MFWCGKWHWLSFAFMLKSYVFWIGKKKSQNNLHSLNKCTILCWATFIAILEHMWPVGWLHLLTTYVATEYPDDQEYCWWCWSDGSVFKLESQHPQQAAHNLLQISPHGLWRPLLAPTGTCKHVLHINTDTHTYTHTYFKNRAQD